MRKEEQINKKEMNYIDFFSGCGGLSLGLGLAGWKGIFAIEKDPMAFMTFRRNLVDQDALRRHFTDWPDWLSIEPHAIEDVLENEDTRKHFTELAGKVTLVAGGPPCQGFSVAGARNGKDPRNLLVFKQIEAIRLLKPNFALVENVGGFERKFVTRPTSDGSISVAEEAIRELIDSGYNVGKVIINAAEFGVPQLRQRVILFAIAKEYAGELDVKKLLEDTLAKVAVQQRKELNLPTDRYVNIEEALGDLAGTENVADNEFPDYQTCKYLPAQSVYQKMMRDKTKDWEVPTSHRFNKHSAKVVALYDLAHKTQQPGRLSKEFLYENGCHSNKRYVLNVDTPCSTVTTAPEELIHYKHPRVVTLREMARIQSFPDDYTFYGRYTLNGPSRGVDVPRNAQIGNAIPPLAGRAIGKAIQMIASAIDCCDSALEQYRVEKQPKYEQLNLFE
ncbi:MAG: DNA cytosine methyltransferase [Paludibacteraceae bacterium]|nr:DNA cytosine methyltransferase [Paludibacteraceae bacterium]